MLSCQGCCEKDGFLMRLWQEKSMSCKILVKRHLSGRSCKNLVRFCIILKDVHKNLCNMQYWDAYRAKNLQNLAT